MKFEYYVMNYSFYKKIVEPFNIFNNHQVNLSVLKEVKRYLRAPSKYRIQITIDQGGLKLNPETYETEYHPPVYDYIYGFEAFCEELRRIIMWQEWARYEYEISVGRPFENNCEELQKIDCYEQCKSNIPMIAREVIWQYKNRKDQENGSQD